METVACNYCGSSDFDALGVFRDVNFEIPGEFPYVRCRQCGLIFLQTRPCLDEIERYYPPGYQPYRTAIQDERHLWMRWARRRNILKYCRILEEASRFEKGRVLDVGCSTGIFLDAMRQHGWETKGVEISSSAVLYARERFNLDITQGQLQDFQCEPCFFNAITLWNVVEHLYQPMETLRLAYRLLKDDGVLLLVYPSWESLDHRLFGRSWVGFDAPRHLHLFPRPVLARMLESAGFKLIKSLPGPNNYFAFVASFERWTKLQIRSPQLRRGLVKMLNIPGARFIFQPAITITDALGKGGTSLVIARKI